MNTVNSRSIEDTNEFKQGKMRPFTGWLLILLQFLLAVGALFGGGAFLLAPDGHLIQMPLSHLENSPFSDFFIPGLFLFTFLGVYPLAVIYSLWKVPDWRWPEILNPFKHIHWSWAASLAAGVIVIIWITVEILWVPFGLVHILFYIWGAALLLLTLLPVVRRYYTRNQR
jgi:hypothetical protein